jgi:hypothetical protein
MRGRSRFRLPFRSRWRRRGPHPAPRPRGSAGVKTSTSRVWTATYLNAYSWHRCPPVILSVLSSYQPNRDVDLAEVSSPVIVMWLGLVLASCFHSKLAMRWPTN